MTSTRSNALSTRLLGAQPSILNQFLFVGLGIALLAATAQIAIPLPWTPVPITGQTFGVIWLSLLAGRRQAFYIVAGYLALGALGLPLFAGAKAGLTFGTTTGYLVGMLAAAPVLGLLADLGWANSMKRAWLAGLIGTAIIFAFGLTGLAFFLPMEQLLIAGLLPFLPGALIKITAAASFAFAMSKKL